MPLEELEKVIKREILYDPELRVLLLPFFENDEKATHQFIFRCLRRMTTRRMLLRTQWFCELADGMGKVKTHRPALQLMFLIFLAEGVVKQHAGDDTQSFTAVREFFRHTLPADKQHITQNLRRSLGSRRLHQLSFLSTLRILYEVRNRVVHGQEFWEFFFLEKEEKEKYIREGYNHYGLLTSGHLGPKGRKHRESLDMTLTYEEFRDIVIRTAVENIKMML